MGSSGATKLFFVVIALLYLSTTIRKSNALDQNKLYKYDFQGAITNKIADNEKPQYSGFSIKSTLLLKKSDNNLIVRLEQPQLATFNDVINEIHTYNYNYKPIDKATSLDKAYKVYFEDGQAKALDLYKDEPKWVSNFKRGLISFFQLKFQKELNVFSVKEGSVLGDCETDYIINEADGMMNVTKTRNMAKCKSRFISRFFPIEAGECYETERDLEEFKHNSAVFNYNLQGNRQDYTIQRVLLDEMNLYSPFGQKGHSHSVHSKFIITLKSAEDGSLSVEDDANRVERVSYDPPENRDFYAPVNLENEHYLANILDMSSTTVDQAMEVLDELVNEGKKYNAAFEGTDSNYQKSSPFIHQLQRVAQLVGTFNYQKLEQLYTQADDRGDGHKKVFWDLISMIGTNPSFMFMKKLISEGDAPAAKLKTYLTHVSFHLKTPSKALFDEYVNLCRTEKVSGNQQYKRLCLLPLVSLIHQHCVKPNGKALRSQQAEDVAPGTCQVKTAEEYFSNLVAPFGDISESSISEKHFNIKMAGELGVKSSVEYLANFVKNRDEHPTLRAAALWNMIKASHYFPNQVKSLVMPFYYDQSEPTEVRLAAFFCWMNSGINFHEMETLGRQLRVEKNRHIVDYMSSLVESLAKMDPLPCVRSSERSARLVMPTIKRALKAQPKSTNSSMFRNSRVGMSSFWNEEYSYGTATIVSAIFNENSVVPSNLFYKSSEIMAGLKLNPMMVNIQTHRAEKVLNRVTGLFNGKDSFFDLFSLKKHAKRETEAPKQDRYTDVYLSATLTVYGRTVTFLDIDSKELKKMMSDDNTVRIPNVKKLIHSFNNHSNPNLMLLVEKMDLTTNELGLPLFQLINDFQFKNFKLNTVKFDVEPGFFKDERKGKPPTKLTASADLKFVRHNEFFVASGALLTYQKKNIGVGLTKKKILTLPLKFSIDANLVDSKMMLKLDPIQDNLLYIKQNPFTFIRAYDSAYKTDSNWVYHYDFNNSTQMNPTKVDHNTCFDVGLKMEAKHRADLDWSIPSWKKYLGQQGYLNSKFMYFYTPHGVPFEVSLSIVKVPEIRQIDFSYTKSEGSVDYKKVMENKALRYIVSKFEAEFKRLSGYGNDSCDSNEEALDLSKDRARDMFEKVMSGLGF